MRYSLGKERGIGRHMGEKIGVFFCFLFYLFFFSKFFASAVCLRLLLCLRVSLAESWLTDFRQPTNNTDAEKLCRRTTRDLKGKIGEFF